MILTGWKEIAKYLGYGVRSVQRWEHEGLPVQRIRRSSRSPVVADSSQLDAWILRGQGLPIQISPTLMKTLERARSLQIEVEQTVEALQIGLDVLKKQIAESCRKNLPQRKRHPSRVLRSCDQGTVVGRDKSTLDSGRNKL